MSDKFIISGEGPILITSPHSISTQRLDSIHVNELYIGDILVNIYNILGNSNSTLFTWDYKKSFNKEKLPRDPNYMIDINSSIWFKTMLKLKQRAEKHNITYLHFDIHGMKDDSTPNDIEFGLRALNMYRPYQYLLIKYLLTEEFNKLKVSFGFDSEFQGWKPEAYTVTEQGNILDFNSCQIELSKSIRKRLKNDKQFMSDFSNALLNVYQRFTNTLTTKTKIGIVSIPIYQKLKKNIEKQNLKENKNINIGTSYISNNYIDLVENKLNSDAILIPYDISEKDLLKIIPNLNGLIIPGGSYGNANIEKENKPILHSFIGHIKNILKIGKMENDRQHFFPILGICLGFQMLCLSELKTDQIVQDISSKQDGLIIKRHSNIGLCNCNLKNRFEKVIKLPYNDNNLNLFYFSNERIIPYKYNKLDHLDILGIYKNKAKDSIICSVKHRTYPFIGYQFHPEKKTQIKSDYIKSFYKNLKHIFNMDTKTTSVNIKYPKYINTYSNKKKTVYYIFQ